MRNEVEKFLPILEREIKAVKLAGQKDEARLKILDEQIAKHTAGEEMDESVVYASQKAENE